ncbi:MAG: nitronate monooxygenase, partial [Ghiorsea sp.]|nr:nitronate monooxygenase [Ghiorsea sp.]
MSFNLESMHISGKEVLPLIEGGKGVGVSTGLTSGEWAKAGGIGTVSAVNAS